MTHAHLLSTSSYKTEGASEAHLFTPPPQKRCRVLIPFVLFALFSTGIFMGSTGPRYLYNAYRVMNQVPQHLQQPWVLPSSIAGPLPSGLPGTSSSASQFRSSRVAFVTKGPLPANFKAARFRSLRHASGSNEDIPPLQVEPAEPPKPSLWTRIRKFFKRGPDLPVRIPLTIMTLSRQRYVGAGYYLLPFTLARLFWTSRPMYFMVDSGLTGTLLTPSAKEYLYAIPTETTVQGLAGVGNIQAPLVFVDRMKVAGEIPLRSTVAAVVDFFQAQAGAEMGLDIAGMVGMEFLEQYDIEIDPFGEEVILYDPQEPPLLAPGAIVVNGCKLPGNLIGALLQAYRWPTPEEQAEGVQPQELGPPILGIVDTGATYTIINWKAADALGIKPDDPRVKAAGTVSMMGVEGKRQRMPLLKMQMTVAGFAKPPKPVFAYQDPTNANNSKWAMDQMEPDSNGRVTFAKAASVGIGDINFHNLLRMKDMGVYDGPAAIIGQDLWMQRRMLISGSRRTLAFAANDVDPQEASNMGG